MIAVKSFFNRFVNNDLLQILWTYVNFYNRTGHMTQMFSYTKHKINFPFSWVFRSRNSNFSLTFISFKTNICFKKNWFWQFDKELSSFNQQHNQFESHTGCGGSASCNVFNVPVHNSCFSMLLFSNLIYSTPLLLKERKCSWKSRVSHLLLE